MYMPLGAFVETKTHETLGSLWGSLWGQLGSLWCHFDVILVSCWIILGAFKRSPGCVWLPTSAHRISTSNKNRNHHRTSTHKEGRHYHQLHCKSLSRTPQQTGNARAGLKLQKKRQARAPESSNIDSPGAPESN